MGVWNRSDQYNFAAKGVPVTFFFAGFHPDYHKATDTIEKINFDKVSETSQKNELENLFVECIEEVRKDIMKRRLKNEIVNKKKF